MDGLDADRREQKATFNEKVDRPLLAAHFFFKKSRGECAHSKRRAGMPYVHT